VHVPHVGFILDVAQRTKVLALGGGALTHPLHFNNLSAARKRALFLSLLALGAAPHNISLDATSLMRERQTPERP
jgi:hypothetical protein